MAAGLGVQESEVLAAAAEAGLHALHDPASGLASGRSAYVSPQDAYAPGGYAQAASPSTWSDPGLSRGRSPGSPEGTLSPYSEASLFQGADGAAAVVGIPQTASSDVGTQPLICVQGVKAPVACVQQVQKATALDSLQCWPGDGAPILSS